ncbi:MAG: M23 family metallopeptidase, partial [Myxococcales bacterium]|nr:M23 family metallopeptidase [Myxococcales bacterium]
MADPYGVVTAMGQWGPDAAENARFSPIALRNGWFNGGNTTKTHHLGAFDILWVNEDRTNTNLPWPVRAVADGRVVFRGWNASMGNVLVVEHPNGDHPLRAVYHHLTNGVAADLPLATRYLDWCRTLTRSDRNKTCVTALEDFYSDWVDAGAAALEARKSDPSAPPPSPDWGGESHFIRVREGDQVRRGQVIAYAGRTNVDGGKVHLHFALTVQPDFHRSLQEPIWFGFDPWGIYGRPQCYAGLYPTGHRYATRAWHQDSLFAPVMPDFATVPLRILTLAIPYYDRLTWSTGVLAFATSPCGNGALVAGSFVRAEGRTLLFEDAPGMQAQARRLSQDDWGLESTMVIPNETGGVSLGGVWRPLVDGSRNEVLVDVPMGPGLSGWLTAWLATQGRPTRLRDVMPYTDRGRLRVVVSADVGVPAVPAFVDRRLLDVSADQLRRALERLGVEGRVVTRLHRYMSAGDARFLLLHRPRVLA